jgi:hypothetical protein
MRFVRCDSCGAKALVAATQCPKCSHPLGLRSSYGEAVPLAHCRGCDTYFPRAQGKCRWCDEPARSVSHVPFLWGAAGLVIVAGAWGIWQYRRSAALQRLGLPSADAPQAGGELRAAPDTSVVDTALVRSAAVIDSNAIGIPPAAESAASTPPTATDTGSVFWVGATARTWANVREEAARTSKIVGIVRPATHVELGETRSGWSRVRGTGVTGWVDRRLFTIPPETPRQ